MTHLRIDPNAATSSTRPAASLSPSGGTSLARRIVATSRQHVAALRAFYRLPAEDKKLHVLAVLAALREWWRGHYELTIGDYCQRCDTVHGEGETCDPKLLRWCLDCKRWRRITRGFRCTVDGNHHVHPRLRMTERDKEVIRAVAT